METVEDRNSHACEENADRLGEKTLIRELGTLFAA
jgi:hypothetical protein